MKYIKALIVRLAKALDYPFKRPQISINTGLIPGQLHCYVWTVPFRQMAVTVLLDRDFMTEPDKYDIKYIFDQVMELGYIPVSLVDGDDVYLFKNYVKDVDTVILKNKVLLVDKETRLVLMGI